MEGLDAAFWLGVATVGLAGVAVLAWRMQRRVARAQRRSRADMAVLESALDALTRRVAMLEQQWRGPAAAGTTALPGSHLSSHPNEPVCMGEQGADIEGLVRRIDALRIRPIEDLTPELPAPVLAMDGPAQPDDLTLIEGIDAALQKALNDAGFRTFRDIVGASPEELAWALAAAGPILAGTRTDHWPAQARRLAGVRGVESR